MRWRESSYCPRTNAASNDCWPTWQPNKPANPWNSPEAYVGQALSPATEPLCEGQCQIGETSGLRHRTCFSGGEPHCIPCIHIMKIMNASHLTVRRLPGQLSAAL